ncbi:hypothetical protein R8Z50_18405 [Longispora sp. K20-0274]|uniref:hypothetical protein n=1 Tax=Longispora sp. K20-0274 TaxID=3088255 RepID=UPI00399B7653
MKPDNRPHLIPDSPRLYRDDEFTDRRYLVDEGMDEFARHVNDDHWINPAPHHGRDHARDTKPVRGNRGRWHSRMG